MFAVVDSFRNLYKGAGCKLEILVPAGFAGLKDDREIKSAFRLLTGIVPNHPLRNWEGRIEKVGLKKFFDYVVASGTELNKESIEEFLCDLENRRRKK